jgi:hypothetical protein
MFTLPMPFCSQRLSAFVYFNILVLTKVKILFLFLAQNNYSSQFAIALLINNLSNKLKTSGKIAK